MIIEQCSIVWKLWKTKMKADLLGCITCGATVESEVANAVDAKKAWLEEYFQNNDCEVILTQL